MSVGFAVVPGRLIRRRTLCVKAAVDDSHTAGRRLGSVALTSATVMWAVGNAIQRQLILSGLNPSFVTAARFGGTGLLFLPSFRLRYFIPGLKLALLSFCGNALLSMALRLTAASRASFFTSLSVILTPLLAAAVRKELPKARHIYGSIISFLGIYFITREGLINSSISHLGDGLAFMAAFFFASYIVTLGIESPKHDTKGLTSAVRVCNGIICSSWALTVVALHLKSGSTLPVQSILNSGVLAWIGIALLIAMLSASGLLQVWGQKKLNPNDCALIFSLVPVWSAIIGVTLFKETLKRTSIFGAALLFLGCFIGQREPSPTLAKHQSVDAN
ncbi:hypothetical protein NDN08_005718 [Rhodosorus marinus]|uniref:EamA domain-containing protein n=1 Tax=Rhodosorus marinus TaxID=101924 RepID=A0AAV8V2F1_9RHOD|nr:hypothetical protein NDN08_005718 [Rhodosorus marinus]